MILAVLVSHINAFLSLVSLGFHLSMAKMIGFRSLSYISIKPDLENMDILAEIILEDLRTNPTSWIGEVRRHEAELIESFYLTVTDKEKVSMKESAIITFARNFFFFLKLHVILSIGLPIA